jgi:hypothetical protein
MAIYFRNKIAHVSADLGVFRFNGASFLSLSRKLSWAALRRRGITSALISGPKHHCTEMQKKE